VSEVEGKLLTEPEAAELLGKSIRTLARWRRAGVGPSWTRVGRSPRYPLAWLNDFLRSQAA